MLRRTTYRLQRGFTLVELVIVFAIVAILSMLATPMVKNWIQNAQIRSTAEALQNALRSASSEAVRRSQQVIFVLSASPGTFNGTPATTGSYWYYQSVPTITSQAATSSANFIAYSPTSFAQSGISITATYGTNGTGICYNSFGRQVTNTATTVWPNIPAVCTAADTTYYISGGSGTRPLKVIASLGGKVRMCDPNKVYNSSNPDACY